MIESNQNKPTLRPIKAFFVKRFSEIAEDNFDKYMDKFTIKADIASKEEFAKIFSKLGSKANSYSKYEQPERMFPIAFYLFFRQKGALIERNSLIANENMKVEEFKIVLKRVMVINVDLGKRPRKELIAKQLETIIVALKTDDALKHQITLLFEKLWNKLNCFSDKVIIAILIILAQIKIGKILTTPVDISKTLNISNGNVSNAIKRFMEKEGYIQNFKGLVKSHEEIKKILNNLEGK